MNCLMGTLRERRATFPPLSVHCFTTAFAAGGAVIPHDSHATGFGFLTSASLSGVAISPVLSGLVAAHSIRAVFVSAVVVLLALAVVVRRVMVERNPPVESAPVVEES